MQQEQPSRGEASAQDTGTAAGRDELAVQFSELARSLQQPDDPDRTLRAIVQAAVAETGASSLRDLGAVMRAAMPRVAGRADGWRVSAQVRELLGA